MRAKKTIKFRSFLVILPMVLCTIAFGKIIYVDDDANGLSDGTCWLNAYNYLQDALADANESKKHALSLSNGPVEIRVAQGVYKPDQGAKQIPGNREATFRLINNMTLKGSYAGVGRLDPNFRDVKLYETILSGDLNGDDVEVAEPCDLLNEPGRAENSYHVVTSNETDANTILDGFTITGGNANNLSYQDSNSGGGGMYNYHSNPTLANCTFTSNSASAGGGGMHNHAGSPTLTNCIFIGNLAPCGAGMSCRHSSSPMVTNCVFMMNYAHNGEGGGIYSYYRCNPILTSCTFSANYASLGAVILCGNSSPTLTNCIFSGNKADFEPSGYADPPPWFANGGAIFSEDSNPNMTNCTFSGNSANSIERMYEGSVICNLSASVATLTNCILLDDCNEIFNDHGSKTIITYSNVRGGWEGEGNINVDPCFAEPGYWADINDANIVTEPNDLPQGIPDGTNAFWTDGDYHLKSQAGRYELESESWFIDDVTSPCIDAGDPSSPVGDEPEPNGSRINMGAYGGTVEASKSHAN